MANSDISRQSPPPPDLPHPKALAGLENVEIILDISRLLSRMLHAMPTGVDRVEMAYAKGLLGLVGDRLHFAAVNPLGFYGRLDRKQAMGFLDETERRWSSVGRSGWWKSRLEAARHLWRLRPRLVPAPRPDVRRYYLQTSPHHLDKEAVVRRKLKRENAKLLCMIHDLIPIEFPEYARPNGADLHRKRLNTAASLASGLITNSYATADSTRRYLAGAKRQPPIKAVHLGTDAVSVAPEGETGLHHLLSSAKSFFLVISTIEPRKNHILLLNIWRRLIERLGPAATPQLVLIGRRGWENENVVDMLERCPSLQNHVFEYSGLADSTVLGLLARARALLCPSFAEGFGMPVSEALVCGTPVICSDIPSLREIGCDIPDYIDPLDGPAWIAAIENYNRKPSSLRDAQLQRMTNWNMPTWSDHLKDVIQFVISIDSGSAEKMP